MPEVITIVAMRLIRQQSFTINITCWRNPANEVMSWRESVTDNI